ncbi:unnamed protein product [Rangifer tarandus platyrhynchus]|uniref:Uncharacterized protein n=1 Tax=Rangifer tarandus platyrhynchus TaxID=3082113 RepID=A0AC59Y7I3_RANTA
MLSEVKVKVLVAQSCLTFCNPMDCSLPGSSLQGICQARILEWVAISFSRGSSRLRDRTGSLAQQAGSLLSGPPGKVKVAQSYLAPCDPMDYTVHGIFQARILEWVAFPFSRGSSQPRDGTQVSHIVGGFFTS